MTIYIQKSNGNLITRVVPTTINIPEFLSQLESEIGIEHVQHVKFPTLGVEVWSVHREWKIEFTKLDH